MSAAGDFAAQAPEPALQPIDLLLGQGSPAERAALQARFDADPWSAVSMAETVDVVERLRELRIPASGAFAAKLDHVVRRATRRLPQPPAMRWRGPLLMAAAALVVGLLLHHFDPAGLHRPATIDWIRTERSPDVAIALPSVVAEPSAVAWEATVDRMRQRLGETGMASMREALETGLRPGRDELSRWIDPRNALVWMRLDHELRASATRRWETMAQHGGLPAVDERAQQLAGGLAAQLPSLLVAAPSANTVVAVATAVRALIATGADPRRSDALQLAGNWLASHGETSQGAAQIAALAGLIDHAAIHDAQRAVVGRIGNRLVDDVLRCDAETWERRLPELVGGHIEATVLGEVGRVLGKLPAFGVDGSRCALVRQLCLGQLRTRCNSKEPTAEVLAAMVFGYADLLPEPERAGCELQLLRWKPVRLLPDFATVQQLAWGIEPGRRGFTRLQNELRQLAVCPTPAAFAERAAFCLCLAKDYAAFAEHGLLAGGSGS